MKKEKCSWLDKWILDTFLEDEPKKTRYTNVEEKIKAIAFITNRSLRTSLNNK